MAAIVCVNRFRPYIEGLPFRILTDHSSLKWLMSQKDLSGRLARWSLKLQRYDFKIEHRKGSLNVVPDCLSRMELDELTISDVPLEIDFNSPDFEQNEYQMLRKTVSENNDFLPDLCLSNFVYKRVKFRQGAEDEDDSVWRRWIPKSLSESVIKSAHDSVVSCHGGFSKTLARVRQKYFWPSMINAIKTYINNCEKCKSMKPSNKISKPPMGNQFLTNRPFERFYCDFLGPYPSTKVKNTIIFICLDHFTKFIFLKPLKAATSANVITYFQTEIFPTVGTPRYIHSDNGKQFVSNEMKAFFKFHHITHITTGFYAPQSNASERSNREIIIKSDVFYKIKKTTAIGINTYPK